MSFQDNGANITATFYIFSETDERKKGMLFVLAKNCLEL